VHDIKSLQLLPAPKQIPSLHVSPVVQYSPSLQDAELKPGGLHWFANKLQLLSVHGLKSSHSEFVRQAQFVVK
jgi:hypothetical protein